MICLACEAANDYGAPACARCGEEFEVGPPYARSNHVCQLHMALRRHQEGTLTAEELAHRIHVFFALVQGYQAEWGDLQGPGLAERTDPRLGAEVLASVESLDRANQYLLSAVYALSSWLEDPQPELLDRADKGLEGAFRVGCQGAARLLAHLRSQPGGEALGSVLDLAT